MTTSYQSDIEDCISAMKDWIRDNWPLGSRRTGLDDFIHEQADGTVPTYTSDLLSAAADHIELATAEPELGPAFDGSPTPVNIIAANYYEGLVHAMYQAVDETIEEIEEEHTCPECLEVVDERLDGGMCYACQNPEEEEDEDGEGDS